MCVLCVCVCVCMCVCVCVCVCYGFCISVKTVAIAPKDDATEADDDDMLIGPPIALAQPVTVSKADHVSH